jgi:hypothetical protein
LNHGTWHRLGVGFPATAAHINRTGFRDGLHNRVTAVTIIGFRLSTECRVAFVAVAGVVARLANGVTAGFVARLEAGLADRVADIAIAGVVTRLANVAGDGFPAGFHYRLANAMLHAAEVCFEDRLADGVTLVPVTGLVDVAGAGNRNTFDALIVYNPVGSVLLLVPDNVTDGLILNATFCVAA